MKKTLTVDNATCRMILFSTTMRRLGEPAEIALVTAFTTSNEASYITGETINDDGGIWIKLYNICCQLV